MSGAIVDRVSNFINEQQDSLITLLRRLVETESPSSHPASHGRVRRILSAALTDVGYSVMETSVHSGTRHIYARPKHRTKGRGNQLLIGHYDTVWPVGTLGDRPFTIHNNVVHGPGVFDM